MILYLAAVQNRYQFPIKLFFFHKNPKTRILSKWFNSVSSFYAVVTLWKKQKKPMDRFVTKLKKIIFGAPFCPKTPLQSFLKKRFWVYFKRLSCCNFMRKIWTFRALTFNKTSFWVKTQNENFPKEMILLNLPATSCQKFRKLIFDKTWKS